MLNTLHTEHKEYTSSPPCANWVN